MHFEFATAHRIIFGTGCRSQLPGIVGEQGRRAVVLTGSAPDRLGNLVSDLQSSLGDLQTVTVAGEPTVETVQAAVMQAARHRADVVVAIGGGSVIDTGKAVAALLTNEGSLFDYLEVVGNGHAFRHPPRPLIAVPTTAGSGSEVTRNAVLTVPGKGVKASLRSPMLLPAVALIDPGLTWTVPPALTAATGLDALSQLIEAMVSIRSNPLAEAQAREGLRRGGPALLRAYRFGEDASARRDMALASLFSGMALANAGLGAVHGFAAVIGGRFRAAHGAVCAALLPAVMKTNIRALEARDPEGVGLRRYADVAALLTGRRPAAPEDGVAFVEHLIAEMKVPGLRSLGVESAHLGSLVEPARRSSSMRGNPIELTEDELLATLTRAL